MTPELELLAQQLIEAAEKATQGERSISENQDGWYLAIDTGHDADIYAQFYVESEAKFAEKATPANITAVILAFREELKQAEFACKVNGDENRQRIEYLEGQLKQARRDALVEAANACEAKKTYMVAQAGKDFAAHIRALMEKPE